MRRAASVRSGPMTVGRPPTLPCNVTVRDAGDGTSVVEALDPKVMVGVTGNEALRAVADEAADRLGAALAEVGSGNE